MLLYLTRAVNQSYPVNDFLKLNSDLALLWIYKCNFELALEKKYYEFLAEYANCKHGFL